MSKVSLRNVKPVKYNIVCNIMDVIKDIYTLSTQVI